MGDIVGRLFREFAVTLSVTILVSAVVSLTLTPVMCAKLLRHKAESEHGRFYRASERVFQSVIAFYGRTLRWVLGHQTATLWVALATLVSTILLYIFIPKGFFPVQDTGVILGISEAPQSISFAAMAERQQALARVILQDPAVDSLSSFIGIDGTNTTINSGRIQINLKPLEERQLSASDVIRRLQPSLAKVEGITLFMQPVQDLTVEDRVSRTQFQYSLEDPDPQELGEWTPGLCRSCKPCRSCAMSPAISRTRGCRRAWSSTATPPLASVSRLRCSTTRSTMPLANAKSRPSSRNRISIGWCWRRSRISPGACRLEASLRAFSRRRPRATRVLSPGWNRPTRR